MDRSFFRRSSRDSSPLLPQHSSKSYPLTNLPPQPYADSSSPSARSGPSRENSPSTPSQRSRVSFSQPPPPIVQSVLLNPTQPSVSRSLSPSLSTSRIITTVPAATNPLTALSRRARAIQSDLQLLLDAQSAGLAQGRDQHDNDRDSDAGSSTPTSHTIALSPARNQNNDSRSRANRGVIPVRQPRKKKISLKAARQGILASMLELSFVKQHEESIIITEIKHVSTILRQVNAWEKKIASFEQEMKRINDGSEGRRLIDLKGERVAVATEIRELEDRLLNLRAREQHLTRRIDEVGNWREADMSSFREGKRGVESEVKEFLKNPPVLEVAVTVTSIKGSSDAGEEPPFLTLPPNRRTLEMTKDYLSSTLTYLSTHREAIQIEKTALDQGAAVWEEAVSLVSIFEQDLRQQMMSGKELQPSDLTSQLKNMERIVKDLKAKNQMAEDKGWNLLICAIGAELEAFREGQALLSEVLESLDPAAGGMFSVSLSRSQSGTERKTGTQDGHMDVPRKGLTTVDGHSAEQSYVTADEEKEKEKEKEDNGNINNVNNPNDGVGVRGKDLSRRSSSDLNAWGVELGKTNGVDGTQDGGHEKEHEPVARTGPHLDGYKDEVADKRALSPYRDETEESEDDGPPKALLVGIEEEDDDDA